MPTSLDELLPKRSGFWHENRYFIDCVKAGIQPSCNFADTVKTVELIGQIYAAAGQPK